MTNSPITSLLSPPPELVEQWTAEAMKGWRTNGIYERDIAIQAAQWAADQELDACCNWLPKLPPWSADDLRRHRRPTPPSLKEQALAALDDCANCLDGAHENTIRRALEALDDTDL